MVKKIVLFIFLISFNITSVCAQDSHLTEELVRGINDFFLKYKPKKDVFTHQPKMISFKVDDPQKLITIEVDETFATQEFDNSTVQNIYKKLRHELPKPYNKYKVRLYTNGTLIEYLIPDAFIQTSDCQRAWGDIEYDDQPWVENMSMPNKITNGLQDKHIAIWASHGRYYDQNKRTWMWQRPNLFCTTEDLYTQTIVVPYLIPMLQRAGANVFTPRERDWQTHEVIVDNDDAQRQPYYTEVNGQHSWVNTSERGFASHQAMYADGENPFTMGTARMTLTTKKDRQQSRISYQPMIPEEGRYAVYVSYQTVTGSIDDAEYMVCHKGEKTLFHVNQQMGGGTWVYLGTFDFDKGCNVYNSVILTNKSKNKGLVTSDAVRFGGGMGNIERGGYTSGFPRCLEGARYYAQWAGAPYSVYSSRNGSDDYSDDINVRSFMTNWLAGGSIFVPSKEGKHVPIELSLAVHSDAGYSADRQALIGSLAICTTNYNDGILNSGVSRMTSKDFANELLEEVTRDIKYKYHNWSKRDLRDSNYSETRCPEVPSAILETLSHQSFPDMLMGQDPNFRFTLARSIYKVILRYVCQQHGRPYIVEPLQPNHLSVQFMNKNKVRVSWFPQKDGQEPTSRPTSYNVYMKTETSDFDNGQNIRDNYYDVTLEPGVLYSFQVTAVNRGGESFPSEVVSAQYQPGATKTILIVNGFHRLSSPAIRNNENEQGFDLALDPGVSDGLTAGWNGAQQVFDVKQIGKEGPGGLGYGGDELAGKFVQGNTFDYIDTHAVAIASSKRYHVVSCSSDAIEDGLVHLTDYAGVDWISGLEKEDGHSLQYYKTFTRQVQRELTRYVNAHGKLIVSGAYIASDMRRSDEQQFLSSVVKVALSDTTLHAENFKVSGLGLNFDVYGKLNPQHYAATSTDKLQAVGNAFCAIQYSDSSCAAIAYAGNDYRCFTMGFPFECVMSPSMRNSLMQGILKFVMNE